MAALNPLDELLNCSVDELAINALVGNLEARLASPSSKEASNSLPVGSVNNNHIGTTSISTTSSTQISQCPVSVYNPGTGVGSNGQTASVHKNFNNSHSISVQSPSSKTDSQLIGINSIINTVNSSQASNISTHVNSMPVHRSSPVPDQNRNQSPHLIRTVTNSPNFQNARNSPVPSPNPAISVNSQIKQFSIQKTENSAIQNIISVTGDQKASFSQGNCIQLSSSSQQNSVVGQNVCIKQEPVISSPQVNVFKNENITVSSVKNEPRTAAIQAVTGPQNNISGNHITHATNVHIVNAPIKGQPGVITVKTPGQQQVVMRSQIVQNVSNSGQVQVVNVSANSHRPQGIVQVPQGKPQPMRFATVPTRHSQVNIAPRPGSAVSSQSFLLNCKCFIIYIKC